MDTSAPQRPVAGVLWMLFAGICFVAVNALVKYLGPRIPSVESAFLRYLFGLVFLLPLVPRMFAEPIAPRLWAQFVTRGVLHAAGVALWFYAMARIALADVTAINFLSPIYVTIGAAFFLGEKLAFRRIAAIVLALIGAGIILRPGLREISTGHWAMMLAALVFGGSYLLAKITVDKSNPVLVVGMLSVFVTVALAPFALTHWVQPTLWEFAVLAGVAAFATLGHYAMSLAFAVAPVSVTQPVTFLQLVWAALLGLVVFGEPLDAWVMGGGALIMGSVSFITWREARLKRRPVTPAVNATKL